MYNIREANKGDEEAIRAILDELDLAYSGMILRDYWVAEVRDEVVAVGRVEDVGDKLFLSSLGVRESHRNKGVATKLLEAMLLGDSRDLYAYTVIPEFFRKLGFVHADLPDCLPRRGQFECERCEPEKCVCMVRTPNAS
jgi:N-acetylglutamate synthase-like GNAT family acetyltransferase